MDRSIDGLLATTGSNGGLGLTNLTIVAGVSERLVVELRTGDIGCTHCLTSLQLGLPSLSVPGTGSDEEEESEIASDGLVESDWEFSSGLDEDHDLSLRALYNATVEAFAV